MAIAVCYCHPFVSSRAVPCCLRYYSQIHSDPLLPLHSLFCYRSSVFPLGLRVAAASAAVMISLTDTTAVAAVDLSSETY